MFGSPGTHPALLSLSMRIQEMRKTRFVTWMAHESVGLGFVRKCRMDEAEEGGLLRHHQEDVVGVEAVGEEIMEEDEVAPGLHQDVGSHEVEVVLTPLGCEDVLIVPGLTLHEEIDVESLLLDDNT